MEKYTNTGIQTPYYIVDENLLKKNLEKVVTLKERTGCKVLFAQKAFSMFSVYHVISEYLDGTCASGIYEAKLAHEHFGKENHIYAPAYKPEELEEALEICQHIIFNNLGQYERFKHLLDGKTVGIRVNPEHSTTKNPQYDPCIPQSRLGTKISDFPDELPEGISGLHSHTLCQQNSDDLESTFYALEAKFGKYLHKLDWINLGGGHMITWPHYDLDRLVNLVNYIKKTYNVQVYLEPGESIAYNTGFLVTSVLDIHNGNVIMDASGSCHMPDCLSAPYKPDIIGAGLPNEKAYTYRLGGPTCLAGDNMYEYSFDTELKIGSKIVFEDMAHYTMVKNNTFNGIPLPAIAKVNLNGEVELVKTFDYSDFKNRLS